MYDQSNKIKQTTRVLHNNFYVRLKMGNTHCWDSEKGREDQQGRFGVVCVYCCTLSDSSSRDLGVTPHECENKKARPHKCSRTHMTHCSFGASLTTGPFEPKHQRSLLSLFTQRTQEPPNTHQAAPSAGLLLLLDLVDLGRLALHLTGTSQRSVNLPHV